MTITERNEIQNELYRIEQQKLPSFLRMTPTKMKVLRILLIIFIIIEGLVFVTLPKVLNYLYPDMSNKYMYFELMFGYVGGIVVGLIPVAIVLIYLITIHLLDKDAYSRASASAFAIFQQRDEREKQEDREIMMNADPF